MDAPTGPVHENPGKAIPESFVLGQDLAWDSPFKTIEVWVELPYWLGVADCKVTVEVGGHRFPIEVRSDFVERHWKHYRDSHLEVYYIGPPPIPFPPDVQQYLEKHPSELPFRKCKTYLCITTRCQGGIIDAGDGGVSFGNQRLAFLQSLCAAHFEVVNKFINAYRMATYDLFAYEVSTWDVPVWHVKSGDRHWPVPLLYYATHDSPPSIRYRDGTVLPIHFIEPPELQTAMGSEPSPGELELLDAINLIQRGDLSSSIRRVVTAIEVILEAKLREEYARKFSDEADIEKELGKTWNDFEARLDEYLRVSKRHMPPPFIHLLPWLNGLNLRQELENTRTLRHGIVHRGHKITYNRRVYARRSVEIMRWLYNWFEDCRERQEIRERKISLREGMGPELPFGFEITPDGVVVRQIKDSYGSPSFTWFFDDLVDREGPELIVAVQTALHYVGVKRITYPNEALSKDEDREDLIAYLSGGLLLIVVEAPHGFPTDKAIGCINRYVLRRIREWKREDIRGLYLVNHQPPVPGPERSHELVFSEQLLKEAEDCQIGLMTTWDFYLLLRGMDRWGWPPEVVRAVFLGIGRTGRHPSHYSFAGVIAHHYRKSGAVRIEMTGKDSIRVGDTVGYKTRTGYLEERVTSLEVDKVSVTEVKSGQRAGSTTTFTREELPVNSLVFRTMPLPPRQRYLFEDMEDVVTPMVAMSKDE